MPIRLQVLVSSVRRAVSSSAFIFRFITVHLSPLLLHLPYFLAVDILGFLALVLLRPSNTGYRPRFVDMFFMSTSAVTVTGLATVRMEDLSSAQIAILTLLMLLGSEVFVSLLGLALELRKRKKNDRDGCNNNRVRSVTNVDEEEQATPPPPPAAASTGSDDDRHGSKESCGHIRCLAFVVLGYMAAILVLGSLLVFLYVATVPSARAVLARKRIGAALFSVSVTVSSFTNGGLLPTNESMAVFAANRGLLLLLAGQILAGNTLLPVFLRLVVWGARGLGRLFSFFTGRGSGGDLGDEKLSARSATAVGSGHLLLPGLHTALLAATVVAVAGAAAVLFCSLDWDSAVFAGLTAGEKVANAVFMAVNVRQAGENSVDCSLVAPAVLVLFVAMMCMPPTATFISVPDGDDGGRSDDGEAERKDDDGAKKRRLSLNRRMLLSPLACNAAVIMAVCITERRSISGDPLNFSTFNMIFEVISAYGNVGFSTGYSCSRLLRAEQASGCHDQPYSFSGWWSDQGKMVLVLLMLYGRLKGFHRQKRRS